MTKLRSARDRWNNLRIGAGAAEMEPPKRRLDRKSDRRFQSLKAVQLRVWTEGGYVSTDYTRRGTGSLSHTVFLDRYGSCEGIGPFTTDELRDWAEQHIKD